MVTGSAFVDVSLNLDKLSSVEDSVDAAGSDVSFVLCVTGHIVVSSGYAAGNDSSGESSVDAEMLIGDDVVNSE